MKIPKIVFFFALIYLGTAFSAQAQVDDTLPPWFRNPAELEFNKIIDWNSTYVFQDMRSAVNNTRSLKINNKNVSLPTGLKVLKASAIMKKGSNCYQLVQLKSRTCSSSYTLWEDVNRDRKIQPKKELRSVCAKTGERGSLSAKKVACR